MDLTEEFAEMVNEKKSKPVGLKLDVKQTLLIGIAFMSISMFWQVYDSYMPLFLRDFDLDETLIGVIMALDNILAMVMLPLIGFCSDNFPQHLRKRCGRRIPFIVIGSVLGAVMFVLVNVARINDNLAFMISATVLLLFFMNVYRTPAVSLMPDVTPKYLRSKANAVINIMGAAGMALALVLGIVAKSVLPNGKPVDAGTNEYGVTILKLNPDDKFWFLIGITCAVMIITAIIFCLFVKENKMVKAKEDKLKAMNLVEDEPPKAKEKVKVKSVLRNLGKNQKVSLLFILLSVALWYMAYNAVTTWFSSYSFQVLGKANFEIPMLIGNVAAFAMFIPSGVIGQKIGRKNTVLIGVGLMIAAFLIGTLLQFTANKTVIEYAMYPVFVLVGGGWATINVHSFVMSVEMADERTNGVFTGFYYAFAMGAQALTPVVSGMIFDAFGGGSKGLMALLPYALIFSCLAFITMLFVRHGNATAPVTKAETDEIAEVGSEK